MYFVETKNILLALSTSPRLSMKLNLYNTILSIGLSITASAAFSAASAQDMQYPLVTEFSDSTLIDSDKVLIAFGEPEPRKASKDSLANASKTHGTRNVKISEANKTIVKPESENQSKAEADDSILSFNFLYYIFQKYKLQDIVD